jgi:2-oxoglutarate ferredoxin oxidoreductase subunit alpha
MHIVTGLHHDQSGRLTYDQQMYQHGSAMRARKLAVLQQMLQPPAVHGPDEGDLLLVGWGSTKGAIEEAVDRARVQGLSVSSAHLSFLSPLQPGLKALFSRFRRVMTVEINYSDDPAAPYITEENRRRGQLSWLLRAVTLVDVDCWTRVLGEPLRPGVLVDVIRANIEGGAR